MYFIAPSIICIVHMHFIIIFFAVGTPLWSNVMKLLTEPDMVDTELLVYAMTLINKTLNGIPDQDTYYDQVDSIEEQGMEQVIQKYDDEKTVLLHRGT